MALTLKEWRDSYEKAVIDICSQPIEELKRICKEFDQNDPDSYQLKYRNRETQFECEFSFDDFKSILHFLGKTYEEVLNWPSYIGNLSELPPLMY